MGVLTDVFIADVAEARDICRVEDWARWPRLQSKGVDNLYMAALWEVLTDGRCGQSLSDANDHVAHEQDNMLVLHLPDDLRNRLAVLTTEQIRPVASRWVEQETPRFDNASVDDAQPYLIQLVELARQAVQANKPLLLWMCW